MKTLIIEGNITGLASLGSDIHDIGYTPLLAETAEQALEMLESSHFDLVIIDTDTPDVNAIEITQQIRSSQAENWLPIILISSKIDDIKYTAGIEAGADDYYLKPLMPMAFNAKVKGLSRRIKESLSGRDHLTTLYSQHAFETRADQMWRAHSRNNTPFSLLLADMDHFKHYNENYGHEAGNQCLQQVANILKEAVQRPGDLLARYSGEQFIILLPDTHADGASVIAEYIIQSLNSQKISHAYSAAADHVTLSIGISTNPCNESHSIAAMIESSENLLKEIKLQEGNDFKCTEVELSKTILVADHDQDKISFITDALSNFANITSTSNGKECLKTALQTSPDLILLDANMPELDGYKISKALRIDKKTKSIPIIFTSGDDEDKIDAAGADNALKHPIEKAQLTRLVTRHLNT